MEAEPLPLTGTVRWLEGEYHELASQLAQARQSLEQWSVLTRSLQDQLTSVEDTLASALSQLTRLARVEEEVRQIKELLARLEASHVQDRDQGQLALHRHEEELERERQARMELEHRLEFTSRDWEGTRAKLPGLEETDRRHQDWLSQLQQAVEEKQRQAEILDSKIARNAEALRRWEAELSRLDLELAGLRKQDEMELGLSRLVADQMRKVEEMGAGTAALEELIQTVAGKIDLERANRARLEEQVAKMAARVRSEEHTSELQSHLH